MADLASILSQALAPAGEDEIRRIRPRAWDLLEQGVGSMGAGAPSLQGTKVVDAAGKPLTVYRGEHGDAPADAFHSRLPSLSFGSKEAANTYAMEPNVHTDVAHSPRVTPAHLNIRNPVIHNEDDPFLDLSTLVPKFGEDFVRGLARQYSDHITNTNNWEENFHPHYESVDDLLTRDPHRLNELYMDAYPLLDDPGFVNAAKERGFDGAIHVGNGATAADLEYRIFDPSQAVSPWSRR